MTTRGSVKITLAPRSSCNNRLRHSYPVWNGQLQLRNTDLSRYLSPQRNSCCYLCCSVDPCHYTPRSICNTEQYPCSTGRRTHNNLAFQCSSFLPYNTTPSGRRLSFGLLRTHRHTRSSPKR